MRTGLCYAYWTLLFVSLISSCLLFIIVASEASQQQSIKTTKNDKVPKNNQENIPILETKISSSSSLTNTNDNGKIKKLKDLLHDEKNIEEKQQEKVLSEIINKIDVNGRSGTDKSAQEITKPSELVSNDGMNLKEYIFLETVSKNSGITTNGLSDIPASQSVITLVEKSSEIHLENSIEESLEIILKNKTQNETEILENLQVTDKPIDDEKEEYVVIAEPKIFKNDVHHQEMAQDGQKQDVGSVHGDGDEIPDDNLHQQQQQQQQQKQLKEITTTPTTEINKIVPEVNLTVEENPIPVFSEWAQKQMEEAEKKLEQEVVNASQMKKNATTGYKIPSIKLRAKNYASPDCGAKIIAANPESESTGSVLSSPKDEYLLSPCTSRIWFVVELCEPIQAEKIELANFELFSSSPKEFSVSVSNRYPTRDWSNVGQFTAKDERDVQKFPLYPHLFGKFIRVDIQSYYNKEHFCPVSLFRVYGTSEFEAFETENQPNLLDGEDYDDNDEETATEMSSKNTQNNLFKSASDAVLSIVKKAAQVLGKSDSPEQNRKNVNNIRNLLITSSRTEEYFTYAYVILCENCSDKLFTEVSELLNSKNQLLSSLLRVDVIRKFIYKSQICANIVGLDLSQIRNSLESSSSHHHDHHHYQHQFINLRQDFISNLFPIRYIAAMCNMIAVMEKKVGLNTSYSGNGSNDDINDPTSNLTIDQKRSNILQPDTLLDEKKKVVGTKPKKIVDKNIPSASISDKNENSEPTDPVLIPSVPTPSSPTSSSPDSIPSQQTSSIPETNLDNQNIDNILPQPSKTIEIVETLDIIPTIPHPDEPTIDQLQTQIQSPPTLMESEQQDNQDKLASQQQPNENNINIFNVIDEPSLGTETANLENTQPQITEEPEQKQQEVKQNESNLNNWDTLDSTEQLVENSPDRTIILPTDSSQTNGMDGNTATATIPQPIQKVHSESVFLRLSNRIKALERNMSLSGQYLEELSRRYKKQVEELQHSFAKTVLSIEEQNRRSLDREQQLLNQNNKLRQDLDELIDRIFSWKTVAIGFGGFMAIQTIIMFVLLKFCSRGGYSTDVKNVIIAKRGRKNDKSSVVKRRKSVEGVSGHISPLSRKRRPSEEALNINGTYKDLLITEDDYIVNLGSDSIQENNGKTKKGKTRNRKTSVPNGPQVQNNNQKSKRASSVDISQNNGSRKTKQQLFRQESAPGDSAFTNEIDDLSSLATTTMTEALPLEENDEFYLPGSDLAYNEFMPDGPASLAAQNKAELVTNQKAKVIKTRRLSSPAFLKSALTRSNHNFNKKSSSSSSSSSVAEPTSWEWYRLKKSSPADSKKKAKSESPDIVINGFSNGTGTGTSFNSDVTGVSSNDSLRTPKKPGSFRRMLRRVF